MPTIAIIGGSGLYDLPGLQKVKRVRVKTPFGDPSDAITEGEIGGLRLLFLPRHGEGHRLLPSEVPARANIWALKKLGAERVISVSAVGSMKEEIHPGDLVIPSQFFDRTRQRPPSFFGNGCVAHVAFADPVCPVLAGALDAAAHAVGGTRVHGGGVYICIEGPQFSTRGESLLFRSWGVDVIGMTALPEARLAREAELCYATLALATDYDCWHEAHEAVTVEQVVATMRRNVEAARRVVRDAAARVPAARACACATALKHAIMTAPERIAPGARRALDLLIGKYLPRAAAKKKAAPARRAARRGRRGHEPN
jgi:5'-methylthioadenosine phosphorylase